MDLAGQGSASAGPKEKVLYSFNGSKGEGGSLAAPVMDSAGHLYGTAGVVFELTHGNRGWSEKDIFSFSNILDGDGPAAPLIIDHSSNLYGTTVGGGAQDQGVAFELTPESSGWAETVLYNFCSQGGAYCTDGERPFAGLVMDKAGNLYGLTTFGGPYNSGVAFELTPNATGWTETTIHDFGAKPNDGSLPYFTPILDESGNLYGTTKVGGRSPGYGTVFELSPVSGGGWKERVLYRFKGGSDGYGPYGGLVRDAVGNLYGSTQNGDGVHSFGTVFRLSPGRHGHWKETVLHVFTGYAHGGGPGDTMVLDKAGNLYGTAGGGNPGNGLVFKLSPQPHGKWKYSIVYKFNGPDGIWPQGVIFDKPQKHLYGTTTYGGAYGYGVVFQVTP